VLAFFTAAGKRCTRVREGRQREVVDGVRCGSPLPSRSFPSARCRRVAGAASVRSVWTHRAEDARPRRVFDEWVKVQDGERLPPPPAAPAPDRDYAA